MARKLDDLYTFGLKAQGSPTLAPGKGGDGLGGLGALDVSPVALKQTGMTGGDKTPPLGGGALAANSQTASPFGKSMTMQAATLSAHAGSPGAGASSGAAAANKSVSSRARGVRKAVTLVTAGLLRGPSAFDMKRFEPFNLMMPQILKHKAPLDSLVTLLQMMKQILKA